MREKIFQTILISVGTIVTAILIWLGTPIQDLLKQLPAHISIRIMVILLLWLILSLAYIIYLKRKHRLIPIHGLFRDRQWNFFCPDCGSLLAYRSDTSKEQHHFHCHKCKSSRFPDNNMTMEQLLSEK
jgi:ribosomal protein S27AE